MKRLIILLLLVVVPECILAQHLKVNVLSEGEPLPYAFISVNGRKEIAADSTGVARLPLKAVKLGDTISASFLGLRSSEKVYSDSVASRGECTLELTSAIEIEEVVVSVRRNDIKELFRKYYKGTSPDAYNKKYIIPFDYTYEDASGIRYCRGNMTMAFDNRLDVHFRYRQLDLEAIGDTLGVTRLVGHTMGGCIEFMYILNIIEKRKDLNIYRSYGQKRPHIFYHGIQERMHVFTQSYEEPGATIQVLYRIDSETKVIRRVEYSLLSETATITYNKTFALSERNKLIITDYEFEEELRYPYPSPSFFSIKFSDIQTIDYRDIFYK